MKEKDLGCMHFPFPCEGLDSTTQMMGHKNLSLDAVCGTNVICPCLFVCVSLKKFESTSISSGVFIFLNWLSLKSFKQISNATKEKRHYLKSGWDHCFGPTLCKAKTKSSVPFLHYTFLWILLRVGDSYIS